MGLRWMISLVVAMVLIAGPAAADDSAFNKEGFWNVGRGDADAKGCMASASAKDGTMLLIRVAPGHVDFVVGKDRPMRAGKEGVLAIDDRRFGFAPDYTDKRDMLFFEDSGAQAFAAARSARHVMMQVDGRNLLDISLENTGVEGALDAVVACAEGKSGWWGPGVGAESLSDGPTPNKAADGIVMNKEGVWGVATGSEPGVCVAQARADEHRHLQVLAAMGQLGLAVGTDGEDLPRGRKGKVETDVGTFAFRPQYGADSYMASAEPLAREDLAGLRRAQWIKVAVDGRLLVDAALEGSGFPELLDAVAACSRGEAGWWGDGAKAR